MPGIDFAAVRSQISIEQVLRMLDFQTTRRRGHHLRGHCPLSCGAKNAFAADTITGRYRCFACGSRGTQLSLWSTATDLPLYTATIDLCQKAGLATPWLHLK